jgi:hypothetical protein
MEPNIPNQPNQSLMPETQASASQPEIVKAPGSNSGNPIKYILIALAILIIIVISGGAYMLNKNSVRTVTTLPSPTPMLTVNTTSIPTPDPTAIWKTYKDPNNRFSFKYPIDWKIDLNARNCLDVDCVSLNVYNPNSLKKFTGNGGSITNVATTFFSVQEVFETTQTAKSWVDNSTSQVPYNTAPNLKRQSSIINGLEAELFSAEGEGSQGYNIVISNGTKLVSINSSLSNLNGNSIENKILTTFKFTDQTSQTDISNWKTYTGANFTLKYPAEFSSITSGTTLNIKDSTGAFDLEINTEPTNLDLNSYVDQKSLCISIKSTNGKQYQIDFENSLRFDKTPCGQVGSTDIYIVRKGIAYHFTIATQANYDSFVPVLNQIISTFKFTQ